MTAISAEPLERRRTAIATSGWGARFDFFQPHNACFWVYLGLVGLRPLVRRHGGARPRAARSTRPTPPRWSPRGCSRAAFLAFLHRVDRWERTPASLALAAFLGGGFAATFAIAIIGNGAIMSIYTKVFGAGVGRPTGRRG